MHEASMMRAFMSEVDRIARSEGAKRVSSITVWLGALSHMSEAHFAEHFRDSSLGSIADGAQLDVTVSEDLDDPNAQEVIIRSVEIET